MTPALQSAAVGARAWETALTALTLFAVDPQGTGGLRLHANAGPVRTRFLAILGMLLPAGTPQKKMPSNIDSARLLGGLDLAATLGSGRPVAERGLLAEADGGVLTIAMAERFSANPAALVAAALDHGEVSAERDGLTLRFPARFGVLALDEGAGDDERPPKALTERLAFDVDLAPVRLKDLTEPETSASDIAAARKRLPTVTVDSHVISALCETAVALGIGSVRAELLALAVARASAALCRRDHIDEADATLAARLVFGQRATQMPAPSEVEQTSEPDTKDTGSPPNPRDNVPSSDNETAPNDLSEILRSAVAVSLPPDLLARTARAIGPARSRSDGRAGAAKPGGARGRMLGTRPGMPQPGARLNLVETLRAAAPWQRLRSESTQVAPAPGRILIRAGDLRVSRHKSRTRTAIVFAVDASGSQALNRLAEAKGAVELLLADCYVRRDQVAVIAFRGSGADVLLPPTHSLTRAKRALAGLPGGGATPLAAGIDAACTLATQIRRCGETALVVLLTDGQANVGRDGKGGRAQAEAEALAAARAIRASGLPSVLIDTAPRPAKRARDVADAMGADYIALPQANAHAVSAVLKEAASALG